MPSEPPTASAEAPDDAHLRSADAGAVAVTGSTLRLQARIVGLLTSFGAMVVVVRCLGKAQFGQLTLIVALVTIVSGISDLGLSGVGIREWIRRDAGERSALLADLLGLRLVAIVIGGVCAVGIAAAAGYGQTVVVGLALALVGTVFNAAQSALSIPLIAQLRQGVVGAVELLSVVVQAVLQALLALSGAGVVPIAAAMIPSGMAALVAVVLVSGRQLPWPRVHLERLRALLRESAAFAAAGAVSILYLRVAVLLGPAFLSASAFGAFAVAFRAVEPLTMLPALLISALFPILTHAALHDRARLARGYDLLSRSAAALGGLAAATTIGAAPLVTMAFTGHRSPVTVDSFAILGCALGALFVGAAGMWMLLAERRYRAVLAINVLALTCNVGLTTVVGTSLAPRWFGLGILAAETLIALAADVVCRRGLRASGHALPTRAGAQRLKVVAAVLCALGALAATRNLFPLVPLAAALAAAGGVLLLTRAIPGELLAMGREVARRLARRPPDARLAR